MRAALLLLLLSPWPRPPQGYHAAEQWKNSYCSRGAAAVEAPTPARPPRTGMVAAGPESQGLRLRSIAAIVFPLRRRFAQVSEAKSNGAGSAIWTLEQTDGAEIRLKNVAHPEAFPT